MSVIPTVFILSIMVSVNTWASDAIGKNPDTPVIGIIIDDIGNQLGSGARAIKLPGQITYAFLPYTPYSRTLATAAVRDHKEIILHMPMESSDDKETGPGGLTQDMGHNRFKTILADALVSIPSISGVNNHMGSLLTKNNGHMRWFMAELIKHSDLYFVDSKTTTESVAYQVAKNFGVPSLSRDIFLDSKPETKFISRQFEQLLALAYHRGYALAIGHTYPETLDFLEQELPRLKNYGVDLVPVSELINRNNFKSQAYIGSNVFENQNSTRH